MIDRLITIIYLVSLSVPSFYVASSLSLFDYKYKHLRIQTSHTNNPEHTLLIPSLLRRLHFLPRSLPLHSILPLSHLLTLPLLLHILLPTPFLLLLHQLLFLLIMTALSRLTITTQTTEGKHQLPTNFHEAKVKWKKLHYHVPAIRPEIVTIIVLTWKTGHCPHQESLALERMYLP